MTSQRLETRIKKLCEEVLKAEADLESVFQELRAVLHEHNEMMRKLVAERLKYSPPKPDASFRKRNGH